MKYSPSVNTWLTGGARMVSYSGNFEDVILHRLFQEQEHGTYVDVGAHHPIHASNTYHFYLQGWRGITIEPTSLFPLFPEIRPEDINLNLAVSNQNGTTLFRECASNAAISQVDSVTDEHVALAHAKRDIVEVETRTLSSIFEQHALPEIDFLSLDVEGHEKQAIEGNDWDRFRPKVLVVEATLPFTSTPCHQEWEPILLRYDYHFAYFDGVNRFYVRDGDRELMEKLSIPVNVLDFFESYECAQLRQQLAEATHQLAATCHARAPESVAFPVPNQSTTCQPTSRSGSWFSRPVRRLQQFFKLEDAA